MMTTQEIPDESKAEEDRCASIIHWPSRHHPILCRVSCCKPRRNRADCAQHTNTPGVPLGAEPQSGRSPSSAALAAARIISGPLFRMLPTFGFASKTSISSDS